MKSLKILFYYINPLARLLGRLWQTLIRTWHTAEGQLRFTLRTTEFCVSVHFWENILKYSKH